MEHGTWNMEHSGTSRNFPEHEKIKIIFMKKKIIMCERGFMQMTVMSEGLLLNSKYIKMGREEGGFQAFLTQPPLVIVCYKLII